MAAGDLGCPRTRNLLAALGRLPESESKIQNPKSKIAAGGLV
jgi:hypothetical protein